MKFTWSFYHQLICVGDDCVEYECMKFKCEDDVEKIFFIFLKFSSKGLIELNVNFGWSLLILLCKPMKPRSDDEIYSDAC